MVTQARKPTFRKNLGVQNLPENNCSSFVYGRKYVSLSCQNQRHTFELTFKIIFLRFVKSF